MRKNFIFSGQSFTRNLMLLAAVSIFGFSNAQNWLWADSFGGSGQDRSGAVVTDTQDNVLVVGTFYSPTLNFGSHQVVNQGEADSYLAKFDSNGNPLNAIGIGTEALEGGMGVGTDANDNVYVVGYFSGETLTIGSVILTNQDTGGTSDFFIAKFNSDLELQWAKSAGSAVGDGANRIAVDAAGNSYVTGYFGGNEMFFETVTLNSYGAMDIFTVKYDTDGNELWAVNAGGTGYEQGVDIAADESGNSYVIGYFSSPTATFGFTDITNSGINDIFVVKYDQNGIEQWVKAIGGSSYEGGTGVSVSAVGVYITGYFASSILDFGNGIQTTNNGDQSVFAAGFDPDGIALWAQSSQGTGQYMSENIAADDMGKVYIVGEFNNSAFGFDGETLTNQGGNDVFIVQFDAFYGNREWITSIGGTQNEACKAVYSNTMGRVHFAGNFASGSINIGGTELTNANPDSDDIFVAKVSNSMGVSEISSANLSVYPNPSTGLFNLKSDTQIKSVEVIGMTGQTVFKTDVNSDQAVISLQNRPAGVYILKVQTGKGVKTQKLIIRK